MTDDELNKIVDRVIDKIVDKKFNNSFINEKIDKKLSEDTRLTLIGILDDCHSDIVYEVSEIINVDIRNLIPYLIRSDDQIRYEIAKIAREEVMKSSLMSDIYSLEAKVNNLDAVVNNLISKDKLNY